MVILPRNEISRMRALAVLAILMGVLLLVGVTAGAVGAIAARIGLSLIALAGIALGIVLLLAMKGPSKLALFHQGEHTILATNHLHQANRLRFFRDVLGEHSFAFSDEERERWSALTREGFHPVFKVRDLRKTYLLSLSFMTFDEVYFFDHLGRWDFFDCRNTSEPTYSSRGVSPFRDDSVVPSSPQQPATE